jgi:hypothetical protein
MAAMTLALQQKQFHSAFQAQIFDEFSS